LRYLAIFEVQFSVSVDSAVAPNFPLISMSLNLDRIRDKQERSTSLDIQTIIAELEAERDRLSNAITALRGNASAPRNGRRGKRRLTAAARKRISDAMKARWAKQKKAS